MEELKYILTNDSFDYKYMNKNKHLALQFDRLDMDDLSSILPGLGTSRKSIRCCN